jgi:hypothetical protein
MVGAPEVMQIPHSLRLLWAHRTSPKGTAKALLKNRAISRASSPAGHAWEGQTDSPDYAKGAALISDHQSTLVKAKSQYY